MAQTESAQYSLKACLGRKGWSPVLPGAPCRWKNTSSTINWPVVQVSSLLFMKMQILPVHICIFLLWHCRYHSFICCDFWLYTQLMAQDFSLINLNGCWHAKHCVCWFIVDTSNAYLCKAFQNPICFSLSAVYLFLGISLWWTMKTDTWLSLQFLVRFTLNSVAERSNICVGSPQREFFLVFKNVSFFSFLFFFF